MVQTFPRPVKPKVRTQTDDQVAKVGQLNQLVRDINQLQTDPSSPTGIPFNWYPPAGLTNAGPKFTYTDGVELISYHIKGIQQVSNNGNGFESYLCSVRFYNGQPFIFPGGATGSFQLVLNDDTILTTPLANGAVVNLDNGTTAISDFTINLYPYGNPQPDGSFVYALVAQASTVDSGSISALMAYDFEFLLPNFETAPTIFQD